MSLSLICPTDEIESELSRDGSIVCGMDEVGRGAWAGPLVLAAVIPGSGTITGVRDSKKIAPKKRMRLSDEIHSWAKGIGLGIVTNAEIDQWGMSQALHIGSARALEQLEKTSMQVDAVLLDGQYNFIRNDRYRVDTIIKGDNVSHAIAAASIVAKVFRDNYMSSTEVAGRYPQFSFEKNKGYPAPVHKDALARCGPTPLHRVSWNILGDSFSDTPLEGLM
ncbi:MAG TPA: ribonuclease HII [Acidimicrobiia bacterium]|nr:ribonuclease HII [Acidimicrobiia bacterium]